MAYSLTFYRPIVQNNTQETINIEDMHGTKVAVWIFQLRSLQEFMATARFGFNFP